MTVAELAEAEEWAADCRRLYDETPNDEELERLWLDALDRVSRLRAAVTTAYLETTR